MNINVTPEVATAHKNLEELCEKLETSIDEFCASPLQSILPHEFYKCECVPIAAACAEALPTFQSTCLYEVTACENAVATADNALHQQKRRFEESRVQRKQKYESAVAEAENELHQQKHRLEVSKALIEETYEKAVAEANETLHQRKSELESDTNRKIRDIESKARQDGIDNSFGDFFGEVMTLVYIGFIPLAIAYFIVVAMVFKGSNVAGWDNMKFLGHIFESCLFGIFAPAIVGTVLNFWGKKSIRDTLVAERNIIRENMEKAHVNASAERDQKVKDAWERKETEKRQAAEAETAIPSAEKDKNTKVRDARARKEREDRQAEETAAKALAEHEKKVDRARSRKDQVLAYIKQEYQVFDMHLCRCLGKFQSLIDTWTRENAYTTSILDENRVQKISENGERIGSRLTRVGTVSIWDFSGQKSRISQDNEKAAKLNTTIQPIEHTDDAQVVKYSLNATTSTNVQENDNALKNLNRMAQQGNTEAQFSLGSLYENSTGAQQDKAKAVYWYRKAAEAGHIQALENLNRMGQHLKRIGQQGNADDQFALGEMYFYYEIGTDIRQDSREAANWYRKAAEQGHVEAQYKLGGMFEHGWGVQKDYTEAVNWYRKAAEQGNAQAKESLPDLERLKAASEGDAEAQYELGKMYQNTRDDDPDDYVNQRQAAKWYLKAAKQGHAEALENLAEMFESVFLYTNEETEMSYAIGMIYLSVQGISQSDYDAAEWIEKAAEQGHADAQCQLGRLYDLGKGVLEDDEEAVRWYEKAAEQGHADGQYWLGLKYSLQLDYIEADKWYRKAAEQGHRDAKKAIRRGR